MKEFPSILHINNKENFKDIYYNRSLCYLRKSIFEHIIKEDENTFYDLDKFKHLIKKNEEIILVIIKELNSLGWKCKLSYGGTALFIYSTEKPPISYWEDGIV